MELSDMTQAQLRRCYERLFGTLPDGGMFGWDVPTLRGAYPSLYHALRSVAWEHDRKLREGR